jgi:hypothetical protein
MAERKKVKGKKPTETMRQAQRRKLAEQRAKKARAKGVKTNPTGPARGAQGPARPPVQGPSRRTPSTIGGDTGRRGGVNKYGTAGTPKSGPPGIGKRPRFNPRVRRPGANPASVAAMTGLTIAGKMAETIGKPGQSKMSGLGVDPKRLPKGESKPGAQGRNTKGGQGGSRAAVKRKPQQPAKPKRTVTSRNRRGRPTSFAKPAKPAKRGMSNIPPKEGTGKGSPTDKKRQNVTPKTQPKSTPKVKKGSGVSGVGPVKSGRTYSVGASGKSVSQQNVESLKKMGTKSERFKKLAAEAKKKSLEQSKKNRERNKVRRGGRR